MEEFRFFKKNDLKKECQKVIKDKKLFKWNRRTGILDNVE